MRLEKQFLTRNDCYEAGRTIIPRGVMVHSTGANNPWASRYVPGNDVIGYNAGGNHWDQANTGSCVHAFIGKFADGQVGTVQTLPWTMRAWHAARGSKGSANDTHISFEICEDGLEDASYFQAVYRQAVELTAYLCMEFGLDPLADGVVLCHSEGYDRGIASNHADVMHWFPKFGKTMDTFRADVARMMEDEVDMTKDEVKQLIRETLSEIEAEKAKKTASGWAIPYIQKGIGMGLTAENGAGTMDRPQSSITRQEAVTMCVAAVEAARKE